MTQTIYLDVLVCTNMLVDYFLICAAAYLTGRSISRTRICLASVIGGLSSCQLLLPPLPRMVSALLATATALLMTAAAFPWKGLRLFGKTAAALLTVTTAYGGLMTALWVFVAPQGLVMQNGAVYINIPPVVLIGMTAVFYGIMTLLSRVVRQRNMARSVCTAEICVGERAVCVDGLIDTGSLLTEPFSGLPVIAAPRRAIEPLIPATLRSLLDTPAALKAAQSPPEGQVRAVPYKAVGGSGIMLAFKPDSVTVELAGRKYTCGSLYIGVLEGEACSAAIINPDVIM
ncbi:MAG: hypothetical protein E7559_01845 [Ruminococcaceae bacterium]|nr:hypothetical protein [Oscillospiraceae bacterium]